MDAGQYFYKEDGTKNDGTRTDTRTDKIFKRNSSTNEKKSYLGPGSLYIVWKFGPSLQLECSL